MTNLDEYVEKLKAVAEDAKENCPISRALKGNVSLTVTATLEPAESRA